MIVVAIDGPAGSGKSTVARAVAEALDVPRLDTGAMYRAVTLAVLEAGIDPSDAPRVTDVARGIELSVGERVVLDGADATDAVRGPEVTAAVSEVSAHPAVREALVRRQRQWVAEHGGGVVEGRDIGTVVLPEAPVKVYLTARPDVRARRRQADEAAAARALDLDAVAADLERRDRYDSTRATSPLQPAADAEVIDTSDLDVDDVVARILERVHKREAR